ncbi:hypothetical protein KZX30_02940 [Staphylococcus haemolyticus]|nr:hypothetical protein [Staphylococcus haemolyticus]MBF2221818.1 hypothetical protein [Staphylococcus haemolyticus]MBF2235105.1 hypothetical protein [Staphylococcus haemolyticus]MCK6069100.1 hypothetical protein [Staphylococcus haemolyticus]MCK6111097.1 hypothetical protein [Staphylococcus haemolyticus]
MNEVVKLNNDNNTLNLTDADVNTLINLSKEVLKQHNIKLTERAKGDIKISSTTSDEQFILNYFVRPGSVTLNFRETRYNLCLIRLNLNDRFHKNSDNTRVHGNRINIYSQKEFSLKADHSSYMVAHKLPYKCFEDSRNFMNQLFTLLKYTNTVYDDKIFIETSLFLGGD